MKGIRCEGCDDQAWYVCVLPHTGFVKFYCPHHTAVLMQRATAIRERNGGQQVNEYVRVEKLVKCSA